VHNLSPAAGVVVYIGERAGVAQIYPQFPIFNERGGLFLLHLGPRTKVRFAKRQGFGEPDLKVGFIKTWSLKERISQLEFLPVGSYPVTACNTCIFLQIFLIKAKFF
jgi:hypothetical protein